MDSTLRADFCAAAKLCYESDLCSKRDKRNASVAHQDKVRHLFQDVAGNVASTAFHPDVLELVKSRRLEDSVQRSALQTRVSALRAREKELAERLKDLRGAARKKEDRDHFSDEEEEASRDVKAVYEALSRALNPGSEELKCRVGELEKAASGLQRDIETVRERKIKVAQAEGELESIEKQVHHRQGT